MENYSLSDIAAVSGNDNCFGGNSSWVLIILFAMIFGGGGFGFGNRNDGYGAYATAASQQEILFGQHFQNIDNKLDRLGNGIADATYALNNSITGEGRALQNQLAECCCDNVRAIDSVRYDMANFTAATQAAIHSEGEATRNLLQQNKIEALQGQINQLQLQSALCGVVRYPNATTYSTNCNPFFGSCGCGNGNI
ncbi:MAG: hypothetical protein MJ137_04890 [Clostridia bacterium]|nr:hypothetical protein [Clostridia bacterium]